MPRDRNEIHSLEFYDNECKMMMNNSREMNCSLVFLIIIIAVILSKTGNKLIILK